MSTRMATWIIALGVAGMCVGLICIPAALHDKSDMSVLAFGAGLFSMGALMIGAGLYLKARAITLTACDQVPSTRRSRAGCDICHADAPIIDCKVHSLHLCSACLGDHYDFRSCAYVPTIRRAAAKPKAAAKAFGI